MELAARAFVVVLVVAATVGVSMVPADDGRATASTDGPAIPELSRVDPGPEPRLATANHSLERLPAGDGPTVQSIQRSEPNLGTAVAIGDGEFEGQLEIYEAAERLEAARNLSANRTVVRNTIDDTQGQIETLRNAEREAIRAYYDGRIDGSELLDRLARVDASAGSVKSGFDYFIALARSVGPPTEQTVEGTPLGTRAGWIQRDLGSFESPLRERLSLALRGVRSGPRVRVVVSADGAVFETIVDGTYVRDAVRFDNYDPTQPSQLSLSEAAQQVESRYPTLTQGGRSTGIASDPIGQRLWRILIEHEYGASEVYIDRSTEELYREVHRFSLDRLPTDRVERASGDGLTVTVNDTFGENPYLVRVRDASGRPVDATVRVDGRRVGTTGADGNLWLIGTPDGFSLVAERGSRRLAVNVTG